MSIQIRNNVNFVGSGPATIVFAHGFGRDRDRYATLHGHAADLLEIIDGYATGPVGFVGHSVSAMIGMLAGIEAPHKFAAQVMIGPSPRYLNDGDYIGGFNREELDELMTLMDTNFDEWANYLAPAIMGERRPGHIDHADPDPAMQRRPDRPARRRRIHGAPPAEFHPANHRQRRPLPAHQRAERERAGDRGVSREGAAPHRRTAKTVR